MTVERSRITLLLGGAALLVTRPTRAGAAGREITVYKNPT
jgi:hypothetical protein